MADRSAETIGALAGRGTDDVGAAAPLLSFRSLSKTFGGNRAVDDVSFDLHRGEILALLGQNGAGKSTVIKMLAGVYAIDHGRIDFDGRPLDPALHDPGIAFIHQDLGLVEWMTVAENMALALGYRRRYGLIDWEATRAAARTALQSVADHIDPDQRVNELSRTDKSLVAIARAISTRARVLVLDEPTASLPKHEVDRLFGVLGRLRDAGTSMIYVSHRLDEVYAITDRMVVMRNGRLIAEQVTRETDPEALVQMIVGRPHGDLGLAVEAPPKGRRAMISLERVRVGDVGPLDLEIGVGEIVAMVGLRGAGQGEVGRLLFGLSPLVSGRVTIDGAAPDLTSQAAAIRSGIGFVAGDREAESIANGLSVRENMFLNPGAVGRSMLHWLRPANEAEQCRRLGGGVDLQPNEPELAIEMLSGGNQQKVVMARWLRVGGKALVLEDPTAGVDVGARAEIYHLLAASVGRGLCVVLISTDFEEVCKICHRAIVFRNGQIAATLERGELTMERLVAAASLDVSKEGVAALPGASAGDGMNG